MNPVTRSVSQPTPLLALASAPWTLPVVDACPLFVELILPTRRGVLAAVFLLAMALAGPSAIRRAAASSMPRAAIGGSS